MSRRIDKLVSKSKKLLHRDDTDTSELTDVIKRMTTEELRILTNDNTTDEAINHILKKYKMKYVDGIVTYQGSSYRWQD